MIYNYQPVILIGAARSGTKLVRDLIAEHPAINKVPYDINYVWRLGNEHLSDDELSGTLLTPEVKRRILKQFQSFHSGAPVLIEKTVSNCLRIPYVYSLFPNAKFIHLVRDGRDVVESVHRQWSAPPNWRYIFKKARSFPITEAFGYGLSYSKTLFGKLIRQDKSKAGTWGPRYNGIDKDVATKELIEVCTIQWVRCMEKALNDLSDLPAEQVLTIYYEDLVQTPSPHLESIYKFTGINSLTSSQMNLDTVSTNNIGKGLNRLTPEQIALILPIMSDMLSRLKYI